LPCWRTGKFAYGLAYRALADAEAAGKFDFAGNQFTWTPLSRYQALGDQVLDLPVKRLKGRRVGCGLHVAARF
jgi:hypothetical protein